MAPRTDFHRFCVDFSMILESISQVYFDRYCDEVESEFGFVLPRGRKDAKLRSRRREAVLKMAFVVTFEEAVQGVCAL